MRLERRGDRDVESETNIEDSASRCETWGDVCRHPKELSSRHPEGSEATKGVLV
jgi:hypothetical protein